MDVQMIMTLFYTLIAVGALMMTRAEARRKGGTTLLNGLAGTVACAVWPLTMIAMIVAIASGSRSPAAHDLTQAPLEA